MMWSYITLADETSIAYSDPREDGAVLVRLERPTDMDFDSVSCLFPAFSWDAIVGFTQEEIARLDQLLHDNAPFIFELAERTDRDSAAAGCQSF